MILVHRYSIPIVIVRTVENPQNNPSNVLVLLLREAVLIIKHTCHQIAAVLRLLESQQHYIASELKCF